MRSSSAATPTRRSPAPAPRSTPGCTLLHVEAGLRSYRDDMPEEANRIETDRHLRRCSSPPASTPASARREGVAGQVFVTGDLLADVLLATRDRLPRERREGDYVLATAHRNYNTDSPERLGAVLDCLPAAERRVIFPRPPAHPQEHRGLGPRGARPTSRCATR